MKKSGYDKKEPAGRHPKKNNQQPVKRETAARNRGLAHTAMPFWAYLKPLVPGYEPLRLDKDSGTSEAKYVFGTSTNADYNMKNDELDEKTRKKLKYLMFSICKMPQNHGFYNIFVTGNDCYVDKVRLGQSKQQIKTFHYISLGKHLPPLFKIVVSPAHDYKLLPKDTTLLLGRSVPQFGEREHFLNMYMVEKELAKGKFGDDKSTYLAFSYRKMDDCIMQTIKCEKKKSSICRPGCKLLTKSDCDHLLPPDYVPLQKKLQSSYIVKLTEYLQMDQGLLLSFEAMYGGDLRTRIAQKGKLTQTQAKVFFNQLLGALEYLHERSIVHGDISLNHLFLENNDEYCRLKLKQFSHAFNGKKPFHQVEGNVAYKPPEALKGRSAFVLDSKADIWAFGVCLYECISGIHPFSQGQIEEAILIKRICGGNYNFNLSLWLYIDQSCKDLISMTLQHSADDRPCTAILSENDWMSGEAARRIREKIRSGGMRSWNM